MPAVRVPREMACESLIMRVRRFILILACLLCVAGVWLFWSHGSRPFARVWTKLAAPQKTYAKPAPHRRRSASTSPRVLPAALRPTNAVKSAVATATNPFPYRLANTRKPMRELVADRHAILLENALIDTSAKLNLSIPKSLQAHGAPGAYIVQADGPIDNAFRARLAAAGAQIVSYIPNNAYLVQLTAADAGALASQPGVQAVIPYEPYYKVQSSLMPVGGQTAARHGDAERGRVSRQRAADDRSRFKTRAEPFCRRTGNILRVAPTAGAANWTALAQLPGVHVVEPSYRRRLANDLARVTLGVSADYITAAELT